MPEYKFIALNRDGTEIHDQGFADNEESLKRRLKKQRQILLKASLVASKRIPQKVLHALITDLADLLDSGLVLERALQIIGSDNQDEAIAILAERLRNELKSGESLSQAFSKCGQIDPLLIPLIHAGEVSGKLSGILITLSSYYQERKELRSEIAASLAYPGILVVVSILSMIGLTVYVIPVFKDIFEDDMSSLPLGTQLTFQISDWVVNNGVFALGVTCAIVFAFTLAVRYISPLRYLMHQLLLKLPVAGSLIALRESGNFIQVLGVLLNSGVALLRAMEISRNVITNQHMQSGVDACLRQLRQGSSLSQAIDNIPHLPRLGSRLIKIGDESGRLAKACDKTSQLLLKSLKIKLKSMVSIIEPVVILCMGGIVGFIVISMLLAVFSLTDIA